MTMSDFNPTIYSDIASSNMMPMPICNPFMGGMYYNTNLIGGARLQPQLDNDKVQIMNNTKKKDSNVFYKAVAILSVLTTLGFLRFGKSKTQIGSIKSNLHLGESFKNFWNKAATKSKNGAKAIGKGISTPFKAIGNSCKKVSTSTSNTFNKLKNKIKNFKIKKATTAPDGNNKRSLFSKLLFWKKTPTQTVQTPPITQTT